MTAKNNLTSQSFITALLIKRVLIGAAIGLAVILFFVLRVSPNHPDWGQYWLVQPLVVTPLAGAAAGLCNHFLDFLRKEGGTQKIVANILAVLIYMVGLWMGIVLGLHGTMWN
ncbi:potassium transporter KefB [Emticicia sp. BO119]|uniref:potassium transporter KefB n=1 Tax=Emticicia sp. BO119 TaxID=2757768 RepID=UPI0015F12037|nr:potassium transporter KefB [Emticicia sp. BO119]MBA4849588.1 potassium transporter KefB [Emticicia sp. BO119]